MEGKGVERVKVNDQSRRGCTLIIALQAFRTQCSCCNDAHTKSAQQTIAVIYMYRTYKVLHSTRRRSGDKHK